MKLYDNLRSVLFPSGYKPGQMYPQKPLIWNNPAYWFNSGTSGNFCSTPSAVGNTITNQDFLFDIVCRPYFSGTFAIVSKYTSSANGCYYIYIGADKRIGVQLVTNTAGSVSYVGTNILPINSGDLLYLKVERIRSTGTINCYTSTNGVTYTLFDSFASVAEDISLFAPNIQIGQYRTTTANHGFIYDVKLYINNVLGMHFSANHFNWDSNMLQNGKTFTSRTTGEVWTINSTGESYIQPYLETIPFTRASSGSRQLPSGGIETLEANMPRLDSPFNGCPGILFEPPRTNIHLGSDNMINMSPFTSGGTAPTKVSALSPRNNNNAIKVVGANNNSGSWGVFRLINTIIPSGSKITASVFAKADTQGTIRLVHANISASGSTLAAFFDLINGTTPTVGAKIIPIGDGWYKCVMPTITLTADTNSSYNIGHYVTPDTLNSTWSTNYLNKSVFFYGTQVEVGDFDTSLILTGDSTVTRQADAITASSYQMLGLGGRGTIVIDYTLLGLPSTTPGSAPFALSDNSNATSNRLTLLQENPTGLRVFDFINNINWYNAIQTIGTRYKVLIKWDGSYGCCYVNGVKVFENFNLSPIYFNYIRNMTMPNASIRLNGFHTDNIAVSHSDCIKLTTL